MEHNILLNLNTSNRVKYEPLIARSQIGIILRWKMIKIFSDFQVIAKQGLGEYATWEPKLKKYLKMVNSLQQQFKKFHMTLL